MHPQNPFTFGEALMPDLLVDREDTVARIVESLTDRGRLFFIGPRRFGKTSVLKAAQVFATQDGTPTILVNAEGHLSLDSLAGQLLASAVALFPASARDRALRITEWFAYLQPEAKYEPLTDSFTIGVTTRQPGDQNRNIADALDAIDQLAAKRKVQIGIIIDEFQEISKREGIAAEKVLRARVQEHRHLSYVFSGSDTSLMVAMISQYRRPFYRLGSSLTLGYIPDEDLHDFIAKSFSEARYTITRSASERILALAERVPYNVQRLAAQLFQQARIRDTSIHVDVIDVDQALESILHDERQSYFTLLRSLTPIRRRVLVGLAEDALRNVSIGEFARQLQLPLSTARAAKKSFIDGDILRLSPKSEMTAIIDFVDPFFRFWLARTAAGKLDIE